MLTPLLLNLYNAAVRSLPENRKAQERQIAEELDAAYKVATGRLDKLVNGLEKKDAAAIKEALLSGGKYGPTFTAEQAAFDDAVREALFPAPEGIAQSSVTLSTLMEALPPPPLTYGCAICRGDASEMRPVHPVSRTDRRLAHEDCILAEQNAFREIPPLSPPAEVPAPAEAEPIPAPAVTPSERPKKSSRGR